MEYYMTLVHRYGTVHDKADSINTKGFAMHWKLDARLVNQGRTFYRRDTDVFYMKTAKDKGFRLQDGGFARDVSYLDVERKIINSKYNKIGFAVGPPLSDIDSGKVGPCEHHRNEVDAKTYFSILDTSGRSFPVLVTGTKEDKWVFDITGRMEQFLSFRVKFWCGTLCQKSRFSDKKDNLTFFAILMGEGVEDIRIYTTFNSQMNPGRGAHVVQPGKSVQPTKIIAIDMPAYTWTAIDGNKLQATPGRFKADQQSQYPVTFTDMGSKIRIDMELPKNFAQVLGVTQASQEMEGLQRDIVYTIHHRIMDAYKKKALANEELLRNNTVLQSMNNNLRMVLAETKRNLKYVCEENDKANDKLSKEMTLRRNCNSCMKGQAKDNAEEIVEEIINITDN